MDTNLAQLPPDLPVPIDDGAADHLVGCVMPDVKLASADGGVINLASLAGRWVIYVYPMTGQPGVALPSDWDDIPGARGCTPQSCSFRDHFADLQYLGAGVLGVSAQSTEYQREVHARLHLPFQLLSDHSLQLRVALRLPTFAVGGKTLFKRLTLIIDNGLIIKVFYPVFPPDRNAEDVLAWLADNASGI